MTLESEGMNEFTSKILTDKELLVTVENSIHTAGVKDINKPLATAELF